MFQIGERMVLRQYEIYSYDQIQAIFGDELLETTPFFVLVGITANPLTGYYMYLGGIGA